MKKLSIGIDVGSVSTDIAVLDIDENLITSRYLRTQGNPILAIKKGLSSIEKELKERFKEFEIFSVGTTGSARYLAGVVVGADVIKNEISAHAIATIKEIPDVGTIFEIGGQDSKIIIVRDGIVVDFAMNTVCAAGTGSFLDHQAERLGVDIKEFGRLALLSKNPVRIAGRCTVFAESDMIHKAQMGAKREDIIRGLCESLVRNYLNNVARGKELHPKFVFQGGVSENIGIVKAFEDALHDKIIVPKHNKIMGAIGAAMFSKEFVMHKGTKTKFKGFKISKKTYDTKVFYCDKCPNNCEVYEIIEENKVIAIWGDICGRYSGKLVLSGGKLDRDKIEPSPKKLLLKK